MRTLTYLATALCVVFSETGDILAVTLPLCPHTPTDLRSAIILNTGLAAVQCL